MKLDNIGMFDIVEESDFSEGPLGIGGMLESIKYFLESYDSFGPLIDRLPDVPVSP